MPAIYIDTGRLTRESKTEVLEYGADYWEYRKLTLNEGTNAAQLKKYMRAVSKLIDAFCICTGRTPEDIPTTKINEYIEALLAFFE